MIIVGINKPLQIVEMVTWKKKSSSFFLAVVSNKKGGIAFIILCKKKTLKLAGMRSKLYWSEKNVDFIHIQYSIFDKIFHCSFFP